MGAQALQNLLNNDHNVLISGENNNFFYETFTTYQSLHKPNYSDQRDHPWFGFEHFEPSRYVKTIRKLGKKYLLGDHSRKTIQTLGFKEIRLFNLFNSQGADGKKNILLKKGVTPKAELFAYVKYIKELFPDSKTIFLRRKSSEIAKSGWWKDHNIYNSQILCEELESFQREFAKIAIPGHDLCLDYQILRSQDMKTIQKLIHKPLGLKFTHHHAKNVLSKKLTHSQWNQFNS